MQFNENKISNIIIVKKKGKLKRNKKNLLNLILYFLYFCLKEFKICNLIKLNNYILIYL